MEYISKLNACMVMLRVIDFMNSDRLFNDCHPMSFIYYTDKHRWKPKLPYVHAEDPVLHVALQYTALQRSSKKFCSMAVRICPFSHKNICEVRYWFWVSVFQFNPIGAQWACCQGSVQATQILPHQPLGNMPSCAQGLWHAKTGLG